jgi:hypothetical protein
VSGAAATAARSRFGLRTKTAVPAGASTCSPATVKLACPLVTTYSSSCPLASVCFSITSSPSFPLHALIPNALMSKRSRIVIQEGYRSLRMSSSDATAKPSATVPPPRR